MALAIRFDGMLRDDVVRDQYYPGKQETQSRDREEAEMTAPSRSRLD